MHSPATPAASFSRGASDPTTTSLSFLQRRVARYGLLAGGLGLFFLTFRLVGTLTGGGTDKVLSPSMIWHFVASGALVAIWGLCGGVTRSRAYVETVETLGLLTSAVAYQMMGTHLPALSSPLLTVVLAMTYGLVLRSVYVPSTTRRTITLGALIGLPLLATTWHGYYGMDDVELRAIQLVWSAVDRANIATMLTISGGVWWLLTIGTCAAATSVIYGLRREVREIQQLGQYTLLAKLGSGGMGEVWAARHSMLRRPTAVKLLRPDRIGEASLERFEREVQMTAVLTHPNTVTIFDYGRTPDGVFYYAMELLDGATLAEVVEVDGPQPPARVIHVLIEVAGALAEAHEHGLIHRDIKPANIMLCRQGGALDVAKVLDFGLVKRVDGDARDASLTQVGAVTGTPQYISPETILDPRDTDARSDLYAMGAVGYFLLTGRHVFEADTVMKLCMHHVKTLPKPPSHRVDAVPRDLEAILMACLEKQPEARPASAKALQSLLRGCDDAGGWGAEHAEAWWARHREALAPLDTEAEPGSGATVINVDVYGRGERLGRRQ